MTPDLGFTPCQEEQRDRNNFSGIVNRPILPFFPLEDEASWEKKIWERPWRFLSPPPHNWWPKRELVCLQDSHTGHIAPFQNLLLQGKNCRNTCGLGRCFPSESLLHDTHAEPQSGAEWVSLAQANIKPCSYRIFTGEKRRFCVSAVRKIKLPLVSSAVLLIYRLTPQSTWKWNQVIEYPGAGFQN